MDIPQILILVPGGVHSVHVVQHGMRRGRQGIGVNQKPLGRKRFGENICIYQKVGTTKIDSIHVAHIGADQTLLSSKREVLGPLDLDLLCINVWPSLSSQ